MEIITNDAHDSKYISLGDFYDPREVLLFDIETTGFTAETTKLYLIGCCYYEDNTWKIKQWFNNDGTSEAEILKFFTDFCRGYRYLIHYNGDGFDIPYLRKKLTACKLDFSFEAINSVDLYKQLKPFKDTFHLDNLKQKSIERFLGINRLDKYSGGDLIKIYDEFLKTGSKAGKTLLIQHNYEDLEGLLYCCCLLSFCKLRAGCFVVRKMSVRDNRLLFSLGFDYFLPKRFTVGINNIIITGYQNEATINVPIIDDELKFFFDNYREYYYLPVEDMAVHKSVASFVDKNYREPARKDNCYCRKKGYFITQIDSGILSGYKHSVKDRESFIELSDSFLQDIDMLNAYARYIMEKMI